jgi:6-phospho-3-hexuloisomerase
MSQYRDALAELGGVFDQLDEGAVGALVEALAQAGRIVVTGAGRERLQVMGLAMRLAHMGQDAHVAGEMGCPPVGPGDLLLVTCGPGELPSVAALMRKARGAGAQVAAVTAQPEGPDLALADLVLHLPAQTMADDRGAARTSVLPMGSLFEGGLFVLFEVVVLRLMARLGVSPEDMRARHTNLE